MFDCQGENGTYRLVKFLSVSQHKEEDEERDCTSVIEPAFDVQALPDPDRHFGVVYYQLAQPGIGRGKDGAEKRSFGKDQIREKKCSSGSPCTDGKRQSNEEEAVLQSFPLAQHPKLDPGSIGKQCEYQCHLSYLEN